MTDSCTEEALRSAERYRSLIAAIAQIVWTTDARGQVDRGPAGLAGVSPDRPARKSRAAAGSGGTSGFPRRSRLGLGQAVARGLPYETEWRLRRRDGEYRYFSIHAAPVRAGNGAVQEWIGCNIDITDRKQRDEESAAARRNARGPGPAGTAGAENADPQEPGDTLQACNSREEAYPFIALAATELFPGATGALAVPAAGAPELFETAIEWGGSALCHGTMDEAGFRR